ncbi:acyltransferase [Flavobacterium sp.]|uniref:acyltransferase family protein n=1 Tax=Flavobacterium sp. TaxID=239 RepID=UPI00260BC812|nr:acyltransferase [Flavobacterium sp.]
MTQKYTIHLEEKSLTQGKRIFGLDLLRGGALLMVLFSHLLLFSPVKNIVTEQLVPLFGFLGVEIWFVLGGFLMGNKIYTLTVLQQFSRIEAIQYFRHRCLRILPSYFLVLLLALAVAMWLQYPTDHLWRYFFLMQNFVNPMPLFFSESWAVMVSFFASLILIFGMFFIMNRFSFKNKSKVFLRATLSMIAISLFAKFGFYLINGSITLSQWDSNLKAVVLYRFDAFFIGVFCSWIYFNRSGLWLKFRHLSLFSGFILMGILFVGVGYFRWLIDSHPFFWIVFYLPLTSLSIAFFLPFLAAIEIPKLNNIVAFISKISYAAYLVHFSIILQLTRHFFDPESLTATGFCLFSTAYLILTLSLGFVIYHFFEKPILLPKLKS